MISRSSTACGRSQWRGKVLFWSSLIQGSIDESPLVRALPRKALAGDWQKATEHETSSELFSFVCSFCSVLSPTSWHALHVCRCFSRSECICSQKSSRHDKEQWDMEGHVKPMKRIHPIMITPPATPHIEPCRSNFDTTPLARFRQERYEGHSLDDFT